MPERPAFTEFGDQARRLAAPLGPGGDLARPGAAGRIQHDYALLVSEAVSRPPADGKPGLLAIEADTGIGKTLGYLVPVLSRVLETGERACITTATRQLARQIIEQDGPAACAAVARSFGRAPDVALRLGKSNFLSPKRIARFAAHSVHPELESLHAFARGDGGASGLLRDWLEMHGALPAGLTPSDVVMGLVEDPAVSPPYAEHARAARDAEVVVTTHAALLVDSLAGGTVLGRNERRFGIVVVDEAELLSASAGEVARRHVSVGALARELRTIGGLDVLRGVGGKTYATLSVDVAEDLLADLGCLRDEARSNLRWSEEWKGESLSFPPSPDHGHPGCAPSIKLSAIQSMMEKEAQGLHYRGHPDAPRLKDLSRRLREFCAAFRGFGAPTRGAVLSPGTSGIMWTKATGTPSFFVQPAYPARLLSRLWTGDPCPPDAVVFTSATLLTPGEPHPEDSEWGPFHHFLKSVVAGRSAVRIHHDLNGSLVPERHGALSFVLASPDAPLPPRPGDPPARQWARHVASMAAEAASRGGRVLLLTTSYADTALVSEALREAGLACAEHGRGRLLSDVVDGFRNSEDAVLVTPAAWQGLDAPGLFTHLVLARLPYPPPDRPSAVALADALGKRDPGFVSTVVAAAGRRVAVQRFRQALGRVVRSPDDRATVWIADPRFPVPAPVAAREGLERQEGGAVAFTEAVPERFRASLDHAEIFGPPPVPGISP